MGSCSICVWIISLSITSSSFIPVVPNGRFFFLDGTAPHFMYASHIFNPINFNGHLGFFPVLTIVNNTAIPGVQMSVWDTDFNSCGYRPRGEMAGSLGSSIFTLLRSLPAVLCLEFCFWTASCIPSIHVSFLMLAKQCLGHRHFVMNFKVWVLQLCSFSRLFCLFWKSLAFPWIGQLPNEF